MSLTDRLSAALETRLSRRSFVVRSAFAGSALAAGRTGFLLRPQSAYRSLCDSVYCGSPDCSCGSTCCAGFTEFCCVLDGGYNSCPSGTVMGGWWMAEGSAYCDGPRYYMDCNAVCHCEDGCGGGYQFCDPACDGLSCGCAYGNCDNYLTGCFQFRYGQCNQDVSCLGRIKCRVVTCVPPWEIDDCTHTSMTDDGTADQNAACLGPGPTYPPPPCPAPETRCDAVALVLVPGGGGYGIGTGFGAIIGRGDEPSANVAHDIATPVTDLANVAGARAYWVLTGPGHVIPVAGAPYHGDPLNEPHEPCVAVASTPTGKGYWVLTAGGRVYPYGDAGFFGDAIHAGLATPCVSMAPTPTGKGYWIVSEGGRIERYGDAEFHGDTVELHLEPTVKVVASPTRGYWLVNEAGRIDAFGGASYHRSLAGQRIPSLIVDMVATPTGEGYYLLSKFGHVYTFGDAVNHGSAD
jgi:hypothetical protein